MINHEQQQQQMYLYMLQQQQFYNKPTEYIPPTYHTPIIQPTHSLSPQKNTFKQPYFQQPIYSPRQSPPNDA